MKQRFSLNIQWLYSEDSQECNIWVAGIKSALVFLICFNNFLAQTNSDARIPIPTGTTSTAGPGVKIRTMPKSKTVKPVIPMTSLLACRMVLFINGGNVKVLPNCSAELSVVDIFNYLSLPSIPRKINNAIFKLCRTVCQTHNCCYAKKEKNIWQVALFHLY